MRVIGSLGVTGSRREIESERGEPVEYDGSREQGREEFWRDGDKTSSWPSPRGVTASADGVSFRQRVPQPVEPVRPALSGLL